MEEHIYLEVKFSNGLDWKCGTGQSRFDSFKNLWSLNVCSKSLHIFDQLRSACAAASEPTTN